MRQSGPPIEAISAVGKLVALLLAVTPLPTYLGVWGKSKKEQTQRVESISFNYLLLNTLCNALWSSYAFKTGNSDVLLISAIRK